MKYKTDFNYNMVVIHLKASDFNEDGNIVDADLCSAIVKMPIIIALFTDEEGVTSYATVNRQVYDGVEYYYFVAGSGNYQIHPIGPT